MKLIGREVVRVAILSDIHGNLVGLEAVVSDLKTRKVEEVVCLGDVAASGPQPCEVVRTFAETGMAMRNGQYRRDTSKEYSRKVRRNV